MSPDSERANIADELAQSARAMRAAEALTDLGLFPDAISRLYYALYHALRGLLLSEALEPKTHDGAGNLFGLHFVKPGLFAPQDALTLRRIRAYREAADYARAFVLPETECRRELEAGHAFIAAVRAYLTAKGLLDVG